MDSARDRLYISLRWKLHFGKGKRGKKTPSVDDEISTENRKQKKKTWRKKNV